MKIEIQKWLISIVKISLILSASVILSICSFVSTVFIPWAGGNASHGVAIGIVLMAAFVTMWLIWGCRIFSREKPGSPSRITYTVWLSLALAMLPLIAVVGVGNPASDIFTLLSFGFFTPFTPIITLGAVAGTVVFILLCAVLIAVPRVCGRLHRRKNK